MLMQRSGGYGKVRIGECIQTCHVTNVSNKHIPGIVDLTNTTVVE